jgi:hypothetical protein
MKNDGEELLTIYTMLVKANKPRDVFGGSTMEDVTKRYRKLLSVTHPDLYASEPKLLPMAEEATKILNAYYKEAKILLGDSAGTGTGIVVASHTNTGVVESKPDKYAALKKVDGALRKLNKHWCENEEEYGSMFGPDHL